MAGRLSETEADPTPRSPQVPRWPACRCDRVDRGECRCYEDDGTVTHGGVRFEAFDHGGVIDGASVRC